MLIISTWDLNRTNTWVCHLKIKALKDYDKWLELFCGYLTGFYYLMHISIIMAIHVFGKLPSFAWSHVILWHTAITSLFTQYYADMESQNAGDTCSSHIYIEEQAISFLQKRFFVFSKPHNNSQFPFFSFQHIRQHTYSPHCT